MTDRDALGWAIAALIDGADMPQTTKTVTLMREAARLIAWSGALPHRCDNAAKLFRQMIAEEADGAPFPVTEDAVDAFHSEMECVTARKRRVA